ncbi:hypothetical protein GOP47_0008064 [Adiantum capillus-veneris]|uniref:Kinesin-like protein n=1 Tax=Adiantum capillus-veneris TaxID=13818 RepID=A0A9D4ZHU2_ADICA|nr:hypothetical protein GOP47_0008064 [Adiantum capillus-veneris]
MPIRSRSKSIGYNARNDLVEMDLDSSSMESCDTLSSASHLGNLRSMSRGKLLKPSTKQPTKTVQNETSCMHPLPLGMRGGSHDSIELLSTRNSSLQRRQTLAAIPRLSTHIEEDEANKDTPFSREFLPPDEGKLIHSPQIVGGLQYKTSPSYRKLYKPRNSIDNANISGFRASKKLVLETMQEDAIEGHADRIKVYVRLRPMSSKEKAVGARCCVREANRREVYLTEAASESDYLRLKRLKGRYFAFDGAFPGDTSQEEIYRCSTARLVEGVLEGQNSSVFCYGATGAGKTFTMLGTPHDPGVMVLAMKDLFAKLKQRSTEQKLSVSLSYLEVYNETVRDLLSPGRALVVREDVKQGVVVAGITQYKAFSEYEVMALLQEGNLNRTTEPTRLNETSSRSHAILQVIVEYSTYVDSHLVTRIGKLSLIDLAGSERAIATDQRTLRSLEGANINRSLLALSSCISALVEGKKHIPFRNSKLTQLLKDSLGGACQTAMIANVSPSNLSFGETQNTLYWADRAKEIRTKGPLVNEEQIPGPGQDQLQLVLELQKENQQLRMQVAQLQQKVLSLESKTVAAVPAAVYDGSLAVIRSPSAALVGRSVLKENKVDSDVQPPQIKCGNTPLRTPLTLSSIKRKVLMRSPVAPCPNPALSFHSISRDHFCRKRTFWDITNSPYAKSTSRNIRSNTQVQTPSMLLQPGFLRGRPSPN